MSERRPYVGGNWKMNTTRSGAVELAGAIASGARDRADGVEIDVFPPFVYLSTVAEALRSSSIDLGAQDLYFEAEGAFTGEISAGMLKDVGAEAVIVGHSERRHVIGETDELINRKATAALDSDLRCVLCIGETLEQREAGETNDVNERQLRAGLSGVQSAALERLVIAYEPVWAIGTGRTATPADAEEAHAAIRSVLADLYDENAAASIRIVYGGSVKPDNAAALFEQPDIDGGLIGGASLKADAFLEICAAASNATRAAH